MSWVGLARPGEGLTFAQSGGAKRGGMTVAGIPVWNRVLSDEEIRERYEAGENAALSEATRPMATQRARLSEWLSAKCMIVAGVSVTRRDLIQHVANKLGGVHLDSRRDPTKQPGYLALDDARSRMRTMDLDVVYAELASITQDFLASSEVRALLLDSEGR